MAANLVSLIMDVLTPDIIAKIANALGLDRGTAQQATGASVPSLLMAVANAATKPGGATRIFDAASSQDPGMLSNLAKAIDGPNQGLAEQGSGLLTSLLGGSTQSELANVIGKFSGITGGKSSSLLGMLGPVVMAMLGKQATTSGLDATGLANLLASQKDHIMAAMPSGLAGLLRSANLLDGAPAARPTATTQASAPPPRPVPQRRSSFGWLSWVIPLLVVLGLGWYFFAPRAHQPAPTTTTQPAPVEPKPAAPTTTQQTTPPATTAPATGTAASLTVDGVDLRSTVSSALDGVKNSLQGVTDTASAQAALPKLQGATASLEKVRGLADKLTPEQKSVLAGIITAAMPTINPLLDKVLAIPGVSEIAKPAIDGLRTQLDALAKA